ncbi:MAG: hypothetical protein IT448_10700 [Phycisphaerales bacterium]|nr:hypothetical protein [Phycisphaerales bacterium]
MSKADESLFSRRLAAALALIAFALALVAGLEAGNTFSTTVTRALIAMVATFAIGLIIGAMARRMLEENQVQAEKKLKDSLSEISTEGR